MAIIPLTNRSMCQSIPVRGYGIGVGRSSALAVLWAYFDESGESTDPTAWTVAMGGCVASVESWESFSAKWDAVLIEFNLRVLPGFSKPWFHAVDFAHSVKAFSGWDSDEAKRQAFVEALQGVMGRHIRRYVGCTVPLSAYRLLTDERKKELIDPYFLCFLRAITAAARTADLDNRPKGERVQLVLADKPKFNSRAVDFADLAREMSPMAHRIGPVTTGAEPHELPPLQAADFLAYELVLYDRYKPSRQPYNWFRNQPHEFGRADPPRLFEGWLHWESGF